MPYFIIKVVALIVQTSVPIFLLNSSETTDSVQKVLLRRNFVYSIKVVKSTSVKKTTIK